MGKAVRDRVVAFGDISCNHSRHHLPCLASGNSDSVGLTLEGIDFWQ
jgi:hypothetical protein